MTYVSSGKNVLNSLFNAYAILTRQYVCKKIRLYIKNINQCQQVHDGFDGIRFWNIGFEKFCLKLSKFPFLSVRVLQYRKPGQSWISNFSNYFRGYKAIRFQINQKYWCISYLFNPTGHAHLLQSFLGQDLFALWPRSGSDYAPLPRRKIFKICSYPDCYLLANMTCWRFVLKWKCLAKNMSIFPFTFANYL